MEGNIEMETFPRYRTEAIRWFVFALHGQMQHLMSHCVVAERRLESECGQLRGRFGDGIFARYFVTGGASFVELKEQSGPV